MGKTDSRIRKMEKYNERIDGNCPGIAFRSEKTSDFAFRTADTFSNIFLAGTAG
jgi:hypothetical protein